MHKPRALHKQHLTIKKYFFILVDTLGDQGRTAPIALDNLFHDDFEAGRTDMFEVKARHVGKVKTVQVEFKSTVVSR